MNSLLKILFVIIVFFLIKYNLVNRFEELSVNSDEIRSFAFNFYITGIVFILGIMRFGNFINPITLICLFLFAFSYSFIKFSNDQIDLSIWTISIIYTSIFSYVIFASMRQFNSKPLLFFDLKPVKRKYLLIIVFISGIVVFIFECLKAGYIPILNFTSRDTYADAVTNVFGFFHYAILLQTAVPAWSYILYKERIIIRKTFIRISIIATFITFNYLSKQTVLFFMLCGLTTYLFYNKVNFKRFLNVSILFIAVMYMVNYFRSSNFNLENTGTSTEYMKSISGVEKGKDININEAMLIEYSSKRFSALEEMRAYADEHNYIGLGIYTFKPVTSLFLLEKTGIITIDPNLNTIGKVGTFVIDPYLDFGILGVIILSAFYGLLANRYYFHYLDAFRDAPVKFAVILQFLIMAVFINYINTFFIWTILFFNKLITEGLKK